MKETITLSELQAKILKECSKNYGFLTLYDIQALVENDELRLCQCLVRCGNMRAVVALQDVNHFVTIIQKEGSDYVRDVAFTAAQLNVLRTLFQL